jgi:hypothetical protein
VSVLWGGRSAPVNSEKDKGWESGGPSFHWCVVMGRNGFLVSEDIAVNMR